MSGNVLANDSDPDAGTTLRVSSFSVAGIPGSIVPGSTVTIIGVGALTVDADGNYTFTSAADYAGPVPQITYTVSDGNGGTATSTLDVNVTPVNDAPTIDVTATTLVEDTVTAGTVAGRFTTADPDSGDTLAVDFTPGSNAAGYYALGTGADAGKVLLTQAGADRVNAGGTLPPVSLVVSDGSLTGSDADTPTVTPVNDAPVGSSDRATVLEGSNTLHGSVLLNDSDAEGQDPQVSRFAASAGGSAVSADGVNTITTALGGTVVMSADGTFRYIAPVLDHAGATARTDSFVYRASDGTSDGAWTTVSIDVTDSTITSVADSATVAFLGSVSGNVLFNDAAADAPKTVTSLTIGDDTVLVAATGSSTFDLQHGQLTISADGSYTYMSEEPPTRTLSGMTSLADWEAVTNLYGFASADASWLKTGTDKLDLAALTADRQDNVVEVNGANAKTGIGVRPKGGSGSIDGGEQLVIDLQEAVNKLSVSIGQLNTGQTPVNAQWTAYTSEGNFVDSGSFSTGNSNGNEYVVNFQALTSFQYIRLTWNGSSQGFVLSALEITRPAENYVESVTYQAQDADGNLSSAPLVLTHGSTSSSTPPSTLLGSEGSDHLAGDAGSNTLVGAGGDDVLRGFGEADILQGDDGVDMLEGLGGNDTLSGGAGNDVVVGGTGSDQLSGGLGSDVFAWRLGDQAVPSGSSAPIDRITDFDASGTGGDRLDLRDLLVGESAATLDGYLDFASNGTDTTISVRSQGAAGAVDQVIVLENVQLQGSPDQAVISDLLSRGKLIVDA